MDEAGSAATSPSGVRVRIASVRADVSQAPRAFHKTFFVAVENDAILQLGFLDLTAANSLIKQLKAGTAEGEKVINVTITDTFAVTPHAAVDLLDTAQRLVRYFQHRGALPADLSTLPNWLTSESE